MSNTLLRTADIRTVEAEHLPLTPLMEHAGLAAADYACEILSQKIHADGKTFVLAGSGNNGGDAYVCARHLHTRGHAVMLVSLAPNADLPPDAAAARTAWLAAGGSIGTDFPHDTHGFDLAVDGLFGIGLDPARPLSGKVAEWIAAFNQLPCPRLALDIPSGLDADSGRVLGIAVSATHTITFLADKPGLHTLDGPDHAGQIRCADLGVTSNNISHAGHMIAIADFAGLLQVRRHNSHKGSFGSAAIVGGSSGMAGAVLLAGSAALHLGAGRVYVGMLEPLPVDPMQPELMLRGVTDAINSADAIGIGPGLGNSPEALTALQLAITSNKPLALDADALNLIATHPFLIKHIRQRQAPTVMTPHPAEAARLAGCELAEIQHNRVESALALAQCYQAAVVLKGCGSVIATPDERWFINTTGNAGLATAGSGDVLLGIVTAFLAQGFAAAPALLAAVHLHGAAADLLVDSGMGPIGLTAGELIAPARQIWNDWVSSPTSNDSV